MIYLLIIVPGLLFLTLWCSGRIGVGTAQTTWRDSTIFKRK